jgi:hypothetical protein
MSSRRSGWLASSPMTLASRPSALRSTPSASDAVERRLRPGGLCLQAVGWRAAADAVADFGGGQAFATGFFRLQRGGDRSPRRLGVVIGLQGAEKNTLHGRIERCRNAALSNCRATSRLAERAPKSTSSQDSVSDALRWVALRELPCRRLAASWPSSAGRNWACATPTSAACRRAMAHISRVVGFFRERHRGCRWAAPGMADRPFRLPRDRGPGEVG